MRILLLSLVLWSGQAWAYPQTIRLEYVSCTGCHFSPQGGGALTEYGKGFGDSSSFWIRDYETPQNSIYQALSLHEKLQHQLQARYLFLRRYSGSVHTRDDFLMQIDYLGSYALTEKYRFDLTVGYVPERVRAIGRTPPRGALGETFVLRKAMLAYRPHEEDEWSVGRDFLPAGIVTDDHTSFLRSQSRRNVTDYFTQARWDHFAKNWLWSPYIFAPSFEENEPNQEWGGGIRAEKPLTDNKSIGLLGQYGQSPTLTRSIISGFTRLGFGKDLYLMSEIQMSPRKVRSTQAGFSQYLSYFKGGYNPTEWLECAGVFETLNREVPFVARARQYGPSFHFRLMREASVLMDFRWLNQEGLISTAWTVQVFARL